MVVLASTAQEAANETDRGHPGHTCHFKDGRPLSANTRSKVFQMEAAEGSAPALACVRVSPSVRPAWPLNG